MNSFENFLLPVVAMLALTFLFGIVLRATHRKPTEPLAFGLLFGGAAVAGMIYPITLGEGLFVDLRGLLVGLAVVFAGPKAGAVALAMAAGYRLHLGGFGAASGVLSLCLAYGIAVAWWRFRPAQSKVRSLSDAGFGLAVSCSAVAVFMLPLDIATRILTQFTPIITTMNVIGAMALGVVFRREVRIFREGEQLQAYAEFDPLTKLLNKQGAEDRITVRDGEASNGQAMFFIDIDDFAAINARHGAAAGDLVLATVAERVEATVRGEVVFSRHGGDEFTLMMPDIASIYVVDIAERICSVVRSQPVHFAGESIAVTISLGAYWSDESPAYDILLDKAALALGDAKAMGRSSIRVAIDDEALAAPLGLTADGQDAHRVGSRV